MPEQSLLELRGARRAFGPRTALDGVDLALRGGEIYALLGRNGAGKTTLVRAVCGRVRLDSGTVLLEGEPLARDPRLRRRLGLVPQEIALYPDLTARENLEVFGRLAGLSPAAARAAAAQALAWIDLEPRGDSRVGTLSGGMKRRVNLAAGVLHEPDVLLLDEPTVGVDPQARVRIHELLRELAGRGVAILLATHDLDQAAALADRIGILDDGRLKAEGTLAQLIERTFDGAGLLAVTLSAPPDERGRAALAGLGLAGAGNGGRRWSGPVRVRLEDLPDVSGQLTAAGVKVSAVSLSDPDLYGVFFGVTGKELAE